MTAFLVIGGIGIALLLMALLAGEVLDGFLEIDSIAALDSDVFSTAGIAGLLGGFGFGGAIGLGMTGLMVVGIVVGLLVGVVLAWGAGKLTGLLRRQESEPVPTTGSLVGLAASVVTAIPEDGYGQIRLSSQGHTHTLNARSTQAVPSGQQVWIAQVLSATSVSVTTFAPEGVQDSHVADDWLQPGR